MTLPRIALVFVLSAIAGAAHADEEIVASAARAPLPTAAQDQAPTPPISPTRTLTTEDQIAQWLATSPARSEHTPSDSALWPEEAARPRQVHGEMGASIGTGGYKSAYVTTLIPLGENGTLGLSYSQTDFGDNSVYGYGYSPYSYNGYGYGRGPHGGRAQSFGVMLDLGSDSGDRTGDCAASLRNGSRTLAPIWLSRINADRTCQIDE